MFNRRWHVTRLLLLCSFIHTAPGADVPAQKILKLSQAQRPKAMRTWEALVNVDTGSAYKKGLERAQVLLVSNLKALGAKVETIPASPSVGDNIVGTFRDSGASRILLMIHYDTVFPPGEAARRPFHVRGGRAYGPGAADAKGGIVIILHALQILKDLTSMATDGLRCCSTRTKKLAHSARAI